MGVMLALGLVSAARLANLASGRGGIPSNEEWPFVVAFLALLAILGTRVLLAVGLTTVEALLVAALAPILVLIDAPLGRLSPTVSLAANFAGCLIPSAVAIKILLEGRAPIIEGLFLLGIAVVVSYFASHVVADRGVLLQYRVPAVVVGMLAGGLLYKSPGQGGACAFAAGALGVVFGADVLHLSELSGGAGRVVLGGAGLLDGILLVAVLAAGVAELTCLSARAILRVRAPARPTA